MTLSSLETAVENFDWVLTFQLAGNPEILLQSILQFFQVPGEQKHALLEQLNGRAS